MKIKKDIYLTVKGSGELLSYLTKNLAPLPRKEIKALLEHNSIVIDGKVQTKYNYRLKNNQKILIDYNNRYYFLSKNHIEIIFEDDDFLVINKPHELLSVAADDKSQPSAYQLMTEYVKAVNIDNRIHIVHRLDKGTSGVLLFAKTERLKLALQDNWNDLVEQRLYYTVVEGVLEKKEDIVTNYLKQDKNHMVYNSADRTGEKAVTEYRVVGENDPFSLLEVNIKSGKKNQIRVCMRDLKHPVIGDKKYGSKQNPIKRMGLHAGRLAFLNPLNNEKMQFDAPIPKEFIKLIKIT